MFTEFPQPIKTQGAYIADHRSLVELGNAIEYTGDSVRRLREAVDDFFTGVERSMDDIIDAFEKKAEEARKQLDAADSALSACHNSQRYDEEKREYRPSCRCEERDVARAQKKVDEIERKIERLRAIKDEVEYELGIYREPFGFTPGGGDGLLRRLDEQVTRYAGEKMQRILEVVEQYLRVNVRDISSPHIVSDEPDDAAMAEFSPSEQRKADNFRKGIERLNELQCEDNYGDRALARPTGVVLCPRCHRPYPVACICANESERPVIFNYDLSQSR